MKKAFSRFVDALRRRRLSGYGAYAGTSTHVYAIPTIDDFDSVLSPYFKPNEPGATIIVTKDGKTLFREAYGMADLERNIVLKPEMVLRLGSLTKQFTAAAIMLLSERASLPWRMTSQNFFLVRGLEARPAGERSRLAREVYACHP